jgi:BlaI family penicillinase repressor
MRRQTDRKLGDLELQILSVLWERGPSTVRDVLRDLRAEPAPTYMTVLIMMRQMQEKGYLDRDERGRAHVYRARLQERSVTTKLVRDLVTKAFRGSPEALVLRLLDDPGLSEEELSRIRKLISEGGTSGGQP